MKRTPLNPKINPMAGYGYNQGLLIEQPTRLAKLAGQVGVAPDGSVPDDFRAQAELAWDNVETVLAQAGMTVADICKVVSYVTGAEHLAAYVEVHARRTGGHEPPWTNVTLPASADAHFLIEVDVEAAQ
jgi:enamine deaminase RidA (YjgF/YER057c/UK114 family)